MKKLLRALLRHDPGICRDMRCWCETHPRGELVTVLQPARAITRKLPHTTETNVAVEFHRDLAFNTYERFVGRIRNARIKGDNGFIQLPDGQFAYDYLTANLSFTTGHPAYFSRWQYGFRKRHLRGSYFCLYGVFNRAYYHWLHDSLGQLHRVLDWLPDDVQIIVPDGLSEPQLKLLDAMDGISRRLIHHHPREILLVDELYFIPPPTLTGFDDPEVDQWVSARLRATFVEKPVLAGLRSRRLYVSRAMAGCRRVVNEEEILAMLRPHGFEMIHAEELSLARQAECFARAEVVVAPHGGGLTNLYFSGPGTKVIEIFPQPGELRTCYWSLCEALGLDYIYTVGEAVENGGDEKNIRLPSDKLRAALRMAGIAE